MSTIPGTTPVVLPDVVASDVITLFDHRLAEALSTRGSSGLSRAGDPHVMALRTMFDAIHHTMDEYAALLAERGKQIIPDTREERVGSDAADHAADGAASPRVARVREARVTTLVSTLAAFVDRVWSGHVRLGGLGARDASDVCAEMARVADKWLRFVEATALRDARHRTAMEGDARRRPVLDWRSPRQARSQT